MDFIEFCECIDPGLTDLQKAFLTAAKSMDNFSRALNKFAIVAARGISKPTLTLEAIYQKIMWDSAPKRVRHLAKHAKKARVRKKNLHRIY